MRDWVTEAQKAAEDHIEAVWEYHLESESVLDDDELEALGDDPSIGPFCGCTTCQVREVLHAAIPLLAMGIVAGDIDPLDLLPTPSHDGSVGDS